MSSLTRNPRRVGVSARGPAARSRLSPHPALAPIDVTPSFKHKAYTALKNAIVAMDIYRSRDDIRLDERKLAQDFGISRTPVREAMAQLESEGFVRSVPRRGIYVVRKTKGEVIQMITEAGSGHPGGSLSATEIVVTLFFDVMRHDPSNPKWPDRDRFILSKGHCCPILYAVMAEPTSFTSTCRTVRACVPAAERFGICERTPSSCASSFFAFTAKL